MRPAARSIAVVAVPLLAMAALAAACRQTSQRVPGDQAPTGARPAIRTPVGPVPGPATALLRPTNPYGDDAAAAAEGRTLFVRFNCSGCHGGRAGGGMGPSLRDSEWHYGSTDAQLFSTIAEGRDQGMPAWGTKLNEDQIWKLVAYIKTMRTPREPNPPS